MDNFTPELDAYERSLLRHQDAVSARETRRELETHLQADYEAQIERGIAPEVARAQALEACGDLNRAAAAEARGFGHPLMIAAPTLYIVWCLFTSLSGGGVVQNVGFALYVLSIVVGSYGRRRIDLAAAGVGTALAVAVSVVWSLCFQQPSLGTRVGSPLGIVGNTFVVLMIGVASHLALQSVGIRLEALSGRVRALRAS